MNPITKLQIQTNNNPRRRAFKYSLHTRCNSVPLPREDIWIPREEPYVPGETPTRSISLGSRVSSHHHNRSQIPLESWPEPILEGCSIPATPQGQGYDSDEEDKRNGVPIRYSQYQGRPFKASMKPKVEAEFERLKQYCVGLSATVRKWEDRYEEGRRRYFKTLGVDWSEPQWTKFLSLEKSFFDVRGKLFAVEDKMQHKNSQMYLFMPAGQSPDTGIWFREEDTTVWSLEGAAEQSARCGEYPVLEWRGVDYNATKWSYEDFENYSSLA